MSKKEFTILGLLIILLLCLRVSIILFSSDNIYFIDDDELPRGALTKEIIQGPMLPLFDYLEADAEIYEGGRLLTPISTVPFFLVFGDSYFSLKLVAIFYSLVTLIFWYILLLRFFNSRIALFWSLLFILSTPFYTIASLFTRGAHAEYLFFTALFFIFFFKIFFQDGLEKAKNKTWLLFGLLSGLSFWIIQNNALILAVCFFLFFISDTRFFFKKPFLIYALSFLVGYSPGIYHFITRHWQYEAVPRSILTLCLRGERITYWLPKLTKLLFVHLPQSFMFKYSALSYFYYFVFLASLCYFLWLNRKTLLQLTKFILTPLTLKKVEIKPQSISKELPFLLYFLFYLFIYSIGSFSIDEDMGFLRYRYLSIIYPFIFVLISLFLNKLWLWQKKKIALIFICLFTFLGLYANINLVSFKNFGEPLKEKGYSYYELGTLVSGERSVKGLEVVLGHLRWINPKHAPDFFMGVGAGMGFLNKPVTAGVSRISALFSKIPPAYQVYLYRGLGRELPDPSLLTMKVFAEINTLIIDNKYKQSFYEGVGEGLADIEEQKRNTFIQNTIDKKYWPFVTLGLNSSQK